MRNFSWNCFQVTGNIDAYLLYKDLDEKIQSWHEEDEEKNEDENYFQS